MVFQDYEIIPTKRVNRERANTNILMSRLFQAGGHWNSVYFGSVASYSYLVYLAHFNQLRYNAIAKIAVGGPVFVAGYAAGMYAFGNTREFFHLLRNFNTYRKEFRSYHNEMLYS